MQRYRCRNVWRPTAKRFGASNAAAGARWCHPRCRIADGFPWRSRGIRRAPRNHRRRGGRDRSHRPGLERTWRSRARGTPNRAPTDAPRSQLSSYLDELSSNTCSHVTAVSANRRLRAPNCSRYSQNTTDSIVLTDMGACQSFLSTPECGKPPVSPDTVSWARLHSRSLGYVTLREESSAVLRVYGVRSAESTG